MSNINKQNNEDQEIDLSVLTQKIGNYFEGIAAGIYSGIQFVKRNIIIFITLFVVGATLGYFLDESTKVYNQEILVAPNFGSVDYLYAKIDLLSERIKNNDSTFLKSIGVINPKKISGINVEPVVDIYTFVNNNTAIATNAQNTQNFELVKLLAEDGDINKVIKDKLTSKNYYRHSIQIKTDGFANSAEIVAPILKYLNQNEYYLNIQKVQLNNINVKIQQNNIIIAQIDAVLNQFSTTNASNQKSDKLVYYNENTQLNDIIQTKNGLINEIGYQKTEQVNLSKVIKDISQTNNIKNTKGTNNKMKLILPIFFIMVFLLITFFKKFYNRQSQKLAEK